MEQVIKAKGGKGPGAGRTALVSPVLALYYLFSGTCMALGWVMATGIALAIVLEVLGGGRNKKKRRRGHSTPREVGLRHDHVKDSTELSASLMKPYYLSDD